MSRRRSIGLPSVLGLAATVAVSAPTAAQELTLTEAVARALDTHPALAVARARSTSAEEAVAVARSGRWPGVAANASLTRFQEPMVVAPLHDFDPLAPPVFDRSLVQGRLGVQYTVFDGGRRGARIGASEAAAAAATAGAESSTMEVIASTVDAYLGVQTARAVHGAALARLDAVGSELDRARRNLAAGTAPRVEVLRAEAASAEARAGAASAEAGVGLAERTLARLMGVDGAQVMGRPLRALPLPLGAASRGPGSPVTNPAIEAARRGVVAAEARSREERAGRLPELQAQAGVLDFGRLDTDHTLEWQAGVQLSWPLFTGGARSARIRAAMAEESAARGELEAVEMRLAQERDAASAAVEEADARSQALVAAVEQWTEVARIERLALSSGSGVQSDLMRAEAGLFQARAGLARARHDAIVARVRLARVDGRLDRDWIARMLGEG